MIQEIPAPSQLQPSSMDFKSLFDKAMAMPEPPVAPAPVVVAPAPTGEVPPAVPAPVVAAPIVAAPVAEPAVVPPTPKLLDLTDDTVVKVKVDGVEQLVSVKDYKDGIQREAAFTKRTQALADQRRETEAQIATAAADLARREEALRLAQATLQSSATDPLQRLLELAQPKPAAPDPGELATIGDVNALLQTLSTQQEQLTTKQQEALMGQLQVAAAKMREDMELEADRKRFTDSVTTLLNQPDYALMKEVIPFAEEALRFQVVKLDPQSMDEAIEFAKNIAAEWSTKLSGVQTSALKQQEIARARQTMEPATGSPVAPTPTAKPASFLKKTGGLDWDALRARSLAIANAQ